jgi:hypothetical protein
MPRASELSPLYRRRARGLREPTCLPGSTNSAEWFMEFGALGSQALTRYADCVRVLRDHETFARDPRHTESTVEPVAETCWCSTRRSRTRCVRCS